MMKIEIIEITCNDARIPEATLWIKQENGCEDSGFVLSGMRRFFYLDDEGNEVKCHCISKVRFISSFAGFLTNLTMRGHGRAIEDAELMVINQQGPDELSEPVLKMNILRLINAQNHIISMGNRVNMLQSQSAHKHYERKLCVGILQHSITAFWQKARILGDVCADINIYLPQNRKTEGRFLTHN